MESSSPPEPRRNYPIPSNRPPQPTPGTAKYRIVVQYLGTRYAGWQLQPGRDTVQGKLQEALFRISREERSVVGSGRTDSGVHARAQVAHFRLDKCLEPRRLRLALNSCLPSDIRIMRLRPCRSDFHAQRQVRSKLYRYHIYDGPVLSPFLAGRAYHHPRRLQQPAMTLAATQLLGRHDFSGFAASSTSVKDRRRTLFRSELTRRGHHLFYWVEGDGFLHHMVRNIVGTLLQVGRGERRPDCIAQVLASRDRRKAGPTAQPQGLCLMKVRYSGRSPATS